MYVPLNGHSFRYSYIRQVISLNRLRKAEASMKGYHVDNGYMGYVAGHYYLFASEADYLEYLE